MEKKSLSYLYIYYVKKVDTSREQNCKFSLEGPLKAIVYTAKRAKCVKFGQQDQILVYFIFVIFDVFSFIYNIIRMSIADE